MPSLRNTCRTSHGHHFQLDSQGDWEHLTTFVATTDWSISFADVTILFFVRGYKMDILRHERCTFQQIICGVQGWLTFLGKTFKFSLSLSLCVSPSWNPGCQKHQNLVKNTMPNGMIQRCAPYFSKTQSLKLLFGERFSH